MMSVTSELKKLNALGFDISEKFYEGTWINLTPFMPGDYKGRTWRYDGNRLTYSDPNLAQAIKAKMRYLSLLALASFVKDPKGYPDVIEKTKEYFKVKVRNKEYHLFEVLFGNTEVGSIFDVRVDVMGDPQEWRPQNLKERHDRYNTIIYRSDKYGEKKPIKQNSLKLNISMTWRDHAYQIFKEKDEILVRLSRLLVNTLEATLIILGIGKAVNRGFGRFYYEEYSREKVMENVIERILNNVLSMWEGLARLLSKDIGGNKIVVYSNIKRVPSIATAISWLRYIIKYYQNIPSVRSTDEAIERIAKAVLKQEWKYYNKSRQNNGRRRVGSGTNYHTWTLGLPRKSDLPCVCNQNEAIERRRKEKYGYLIVKDNVDDCVISKHCKDENVRIKNIKAEEGRRQSMFILFPYRDKNSLSISILPFVAEDLWEIVANGKLYHVGGHFTGSVPCCNRHFVKVIDILIRPEIKAPKRPRNVNLCWCGRDPGLVELPKIYDKCKDVKDEVDNTFPVKSLTIPNKAYEVLLRATVCWLVTLLQER